MYIPIYSHVQTDINDQIIAVTAIQWWFNNGPFLDGSEEQKKKKKNNSRHLKSSDLTLIVSHQRLNSFMCWVLFRRLCRAQELTHRWTRLLYRFLKPWVRPPITFPCPPFISFPLFDPNKQTPLLVRDPSPPPTFLMDQTGSTGVSMVTAL